MKITLHKHVVTANKVSFIEVQRIMQHETKVHPYMFSMPKEKWLEMDRPETVEVEVKE